MACTLVPDRLPGYPDLLGFWGTKGSSPKFRYSDELDRLVAFVGGELSLAGAGLVWVLPDGRVILTCPSQNWIEPESAWILEETLAGGRSLSQCHILSSLDRRSYPRLLLAAVYWADFVELYYGCSPVWVCI